MHATIGNIIFNIYYNNQLLITFDCYKFIENGNDHYVIENTGTIFDGYYFALNYGGLKEWHEIKLMKP